MRQYLAHFQDSLLLIDTSVCHALLGLSFINYTLVSRSLLRFSFINYTLVSRALLGFFFNGYYVSMSPIFRITYNWIFALVTVLLLGISFISLERQYSADFQDPPSFDCFVSSSCTFKISLDWNFGILCTFSVVLHSFVTSVSRTYSTSLTFNCYVCILLTFRILFHWIRALAFVVHMYYSF